MDYTCVTIANHSYYLAASQTGLSFVGSSDGIFQELINFYPRTNFNATTNNPILLAAQEQLANYLAGDLTTFSLPLDFSIGTEFQQNVWQQLTTIPCGQTISYHQLAQSLNQGSATRAVATAVAKNPLLIVVPCHRVICADGSLGEFRAGKAFKKQLLTLEKTTL